MIDIIIPVYNSLNTIRKTLDSIVNQLIYDLKLKIYIVDDGSDDDYTEVINFYSNNLDINYIKLSKNMGTGYARNVGIDNSFNEYIIFLDSDDIFCTNNAVFSLYESINKNNLDYIKSDVC